MILPVLGMDFLRPKLNEPSTEVQARHRRSFEVKETKKTYGDWQNDQIESASKETGSR